MMKMSSYFRKYTYFASDFVMDVTENTLLSAFYQIMNTPLKKHLEVVRDSAGPLTLT